MREDVLRELSAFAAGVDIADVPVSVREALGKTLFDSIGVAVAGAGTPELVCLRGAWPRTPGPCTLWGGEGDVNLEAAVMLNGVALCSLELDEGNKFARGHPGAHVIPAAIAEAERLNVSGAEMLSAVLAGYEIAARVARAFSPVEGLHPHGNWGAIGAAVAVGRLNGFSEAELAESMDAAAGLVLASPFASAIAGSFVRNTWVGTAGLNGVTAVRLVQAGLGSVDETGQVTLGQILGRIDTAELTAELGTRWEVSGGYYKRHASCNYTHPPADAALLLRKTFSPQLDDIEAIEVATHRLAAPLASVEPTNRLAAMFSIPHVVAVALHRGMCLPESFAPGALNAPEIAQLRGLVNVVTDPVIDSRLPAERGARVTVSMRNGTHHEISVPNAIGDADHFPLTMTNLLEKLQSLLGDERAAALQAHVARLWQGESVREVMAAVRKVA
ncbi:MmgE/PrpD family protein [Leucobacter aridicollis]|uniref:2-methylcitrate dehydratase PrpD n=1 Tax=Leucobacter aridicollis TaxID=283878 RepID=A0A852RBB3_9MICO|nr:MmgE/PrpD family protein [Leucobacter aridicollis]MBL3682250.1 MmgE/PrpD family protein [Leucobacter aridicollis]NYD25664.1 2-methylcitrate dehydratase PrpD [Leucobacter aridicollis]